MSEGPRWQPLSSGELQPDSGENQKLSATGPATSRDRQPTRRLRRRDLREGAQPALPKPDAEISGPSAPLPQPTSASIFAAPESSMSGSRGLGASEGGNRRGRRRIWRRIRTGLVLLTVLALVALLAWGALQILPKFGFGSDAGEKDFPGPGTGEITVTINPGDTGSAMGKTLHDEGVVGSILAFTRAFDANANAASIQPGSYTLRKEMKAVDAVAALLDPASRADTRITVVEGESLQQVFAKLKSVGGLDAAKLDAIRANPNDVGLPAEAKGQLEGWLAPATYSIAPGTKVEDVLKQMVSLTIQRLDKMQVPAEQRESVLIKASLVEREVNKAEYYSKVATVINNRLKDTAGETRGCLQLDSTVLYGAGKVGGIPTAEMLASDNPYNTYRYPGLPPTPIGAPSEVAIKGVLNPEPATWLYFVTVNLHTGETKFANTLAEHDQYVAELRQWCNSAPGSGCATK